jgi:hypothetical protein
MAQGVDDPGRGANEMRPHWHNTVGGAVGGWSRGLPVPLVRCR